MDPDTSGAIPYTRTALRPDWEQLPAALRTAIAEHLGAEVASARVARSGFTQGFAATLTTVAGVRRFVKAAPLGSDHAEWYTREARITAALPDGVPAARLRWTADLAGHLVICLDAVDGARMPDLPWSEPDLQATLAAVGRAAAELSPVPPALAPFAEESFSTVMHDTIGRWDRVAKGTEPLPEEFAWLAGRLPELIDLEQALLSYGDAAPGVVHCDLRADNVIMDSRGAAWMCDWNHVRRGPAWLDLVSLLTSAVPDHDVDELVAGHPTTREAPPDALDAALAGLTGYWITQSTRPKIRTSPYVRAHQRYYGRLAVDWLARRRGWR